MKRIVALLLTLLALLALPACVEEEGDPTTTGYEGTLPGEIVAPVPPYENF